MKTFEILRELPKCDTETRSEQMLLGKRCQQTCLMQSCHKPQLRKNTVSAKHKARRNRMRYSVLKMNLKSLKSAYQFATSHRTTPYPTVSHIYIIFLISKGI